jgi:hypothetical protein
MLKVEHTQLKVTLFKDATSDLGNGFATIWHVDIENYGLVWRWN